MFWTMMRKQVKSWLLALKSVLIVKQRKENWTNHGGVKSQIQGVSLNNFDQFEHRATNSFYFWCKDRTAWGLFWNDKPLLYTGIEAKWNGMGIVCFGNQPMLPCKKGREGSVCWYDGDPNCDTQESHYNFCRRRRRSRKSKEDFLLWGRRSARIFEGKDMFCVEECTNILKACSIVWKLWKTLGVSAVTENGGWRIREVRERFETKLVMQRESGREEKCIKLGEFGLQGEDPSWWRSLPMWSSVIGNDGSRL